MTTVASGSSAFMIGSPVSWLCFAHEVRQHLFDGLDVRDHSVPYRPHCIDVRRRPSEHFVRFRAYRLDAAARGVEGDD